jgi:hypothetical protein
MMSIFKQREAKKKEIRQREIELLAKKEISPIELGLKNFCMKGVKLSDYRNPDGSFSLF